MTRDELLTTTQVAEKLDVSHDTVLRLATRGDIPTQRLAGKRGAYLFLAEDVRAYAQRIAS